MTSARQARRGTRGGRDSRPVRGRRPDSARSAMSPSKRKARRTILRRRLVAIAIVLAIISLGAVLLFTPLIGVSDVKVTGINRIDREDVVELAEIPMRRSLLRVDTDAAERAVASLPQVESVSVSRSLPSTVRIDITERTSVAYFAAYDGTRLVDRMGVPFHRVSKPPKKLPELRVDTVATDDPATRAATAVLTGIPDQLAGRVAMVTAPSPVSVELRLRGGKVIQWGDAQQIERKSRVLAALLTRPGRVYDVSSPELPTVSD
ncbi:cell division protein FtsQ/DivIB [Haloechinothrix halophila]|uniref:cell division protein FtsQ/DivIB n=1 Tax=Haloechinothrix halophila TaxID=1069073 RepID=UPI0003FE3CDC|nr:FtsQ-type POTRA domain-containing protein [Haloechinothrix halophila]